MRLLPLCETGFEDGRQPLLERVPVLDEAGRRNAVGQRGGGRVQEAREPPRDLLLPAKAGELLRHVDDLPP